MESVDWILLAQDRVQVWAVVKTVKQFQVVKCGDFLGQLRKY